MSEIRFEINGNNQGLLRSLNQSQEAFRRTSMAAQAEGFKIEQVFDKLKQAAALIGVGVSLKSFVNDIVRVRGEFQQLEVAFSTMLGSEEKANTLMNQLVKTAAKTPFDLKGVAAGAKSLMAYGTAAEEVNDMLVRLGDIAAGMSIPLNDLVYLYGTTMVQGRMFTQDLRQFQGRGIPIAEEIAKVMNVAKESVAELVTAGKVTDDVFRQAIMNMTNEGGKFGGLMEAQSKTITGQISNIEDAVDMILNDIGKQSETVINSVLGGISFVVENYEDFGKVILTVAAAYGTYKAALLAVIAAQRLAAMWEGAKTFLSLARSVTSAKDAMALFNLVTKANPLGLVVSLVATAATAFALFKGHVADAAEISEKFGENATKAATNANALLVTIENTSSKSKAHRDAINELSGLYKEYGIEVKNLNEDYSNEAEVVKELAGKHDELTAAIRNESIERQKANAIQTATEEYQKQIEETWGRMKSAVGGDSSGTVTASVRIAINDNDLIRLGELGQKMASLREAQDMEGFGKAQDEYAAKLMELRNKVNDVGKAFQLSKGDIADMEVALSRMGAEAYGAYQTMNTGISVINQGASAIEGYSDAAEGAAYANRVSKMSVVELQNEIQRLISNYNNTQILVQIRYEEIGVPPWMNGMDLKETRRLAETFARIAREHPNGANVNGKYFTGEQLLVKAAEYGKATSQKQAEADRQQRERERRAAELARNKPTKTKPAKSSTGKNDAERQRRDLENYSLLLEKQAIENEREAKDLELSTREAEAKLKKGSERIYAALLLERDKQLEQQRRAYEDIRRTKIDEARGLWEADPRNKGKAFVLDEKAFEYTKDEIRNNEQRIAAILKEYDDSVREQQRSELQSLYSYLQEYGTIQQQKYAIAKEYDAKIAEADDENEKKRLRAEKGRAIAANNAQRLSEAIDWSATFSGVGNVLKDIAKETLVEVENYMDTKDFKALQASEKKTYVDLRDKLRQESGAGSESPFNFKIWGDIQQQVREYQDSVKAFREAQDAHTNAMELLAAAEERYANATDDAGKNSLEIARRHAEETAQAQKEAQDKVDKSKGDLSDTTSKAAQGIDNFTNYLNEMANGSLYGFANGMSKLITSLGKGSDGVGKGLSELGGKIGRIGGVVGAILQILDAIGDNPEKYIDETLSRLGETIEEVIRQVPTIVVTVLEDVGNVIRGIVEGFGSWFGLSDTWMSGSNAKEVAKTTEKLTRSNEALADSIDDLKDVIGSSAGERALFSYETALEAQEQINKNQMEILKAQMGYHGSHHSNASYANDAAIRNYNASAQKAFAAAGVTASTISGLTSIYGLTPEQLKAIKDFAPDLWKYLTEVGKYDKSEYWDAVVEQAGKVEELTETINSNLTQTSFSSMRDSFLSALTDMDSSSRDFANNFESMMFKAIMNSFVLDDEFDSWLNGFYKEWADKIKSGTMSRSDWDIFKSEYTAKRDELVGERDMWADAMGYSGQSSSEGSATFNAAKSFTQEQGDVMNGRLTAIQITTAAIMSSLKTVSEGIPTMSTALLEIRNMMVYNNSYLEDVVSLTKAIKGWGSLIESMERSLRSL